MVKTRFAPSPTGLMHIGQVRTALYAYLVAKLGNGKFILRIEDTDRERFVPESTENIIETLKWLNLSWDEGPTFQSKRLEIYKKYVQEFLEKGFAYEKEGAIWFKTNKEGSTSWVDMVGNKTISIPNNQQEDFVLIKSDGYPTYNFANVVDDHLMGITDVIRGVEFISSTPKHIMVYQAFGWNLPKFVHLPLILGTDRSKLSKRHGAKPAWEFKQDGYLPEAILNYMALLGWTSKSGKEILSMEEMTKEFDYKDLNTANPVFDIIKLTWMNGEYIRKMSDEELTKRLQEYLVDHPAKNKIGPLVPLIKERIKTLADFVPLTDFIFEKPEYDIEEFQKIKIEKQKEILEKILAIMENFTKPWKAEDFEGAFRKLTEEAKIKVGDCFQLIRVTVSGQLVTPPLFESIKLIGEDEVLNRVKWVVENYSDLSKKKYG
ncbi:MAG: glutamate--tRNA ligase [Candidatus Daviesbacteria bacterium]